MSADNSLDPMRIAASLISKLCDECITPQEGEQLDYLVRTNRQVRQFYVKMMHLQCGLHEYASVLGIATDVQDDSEPSDASSDMNETMVVPALHEPIGDDDPGQFTSGQFTEMSDIQPGAIEVPKPKKRSTTKYIVWSSFAAAILVGFAVLLHYSGSNVKPDGGAPRPQVLADNPANNKDAKPAPDIAPEAPAIASLTQLSGAVWEDAHALAAGQKLHAHDEIWLQKGCAELVFAGESRAILEGPARLTLDSGSEVYLAYGQIAATVPGGGFAVKSPSGVAKDLGTQFGVAVDRDGRTQVEVFEGTVAAELQSATTRPAALTLSTGQAAVISHAAVEIDPRGAVPQRFVTRLSSDLRTLDLVDLVSGGDGSTHRRAGAIDALTGESGVLSPVNSRQGDWKIHSVPALPVIDCAFVPDGSRGPMAIDSSGHTFDFPQTANICINRIWAGGAIPWFNAHGISTVLEGVNYSAAEHGLLCIHSNNGMTLDLQAIRRLYPDRFVSGFHCRIGNSYENGTPDETGVDPRADVFVILDGKSQFVKRQFTHRDGSFSVNVSINAADRFLTLATTDGGDGINDDWVLWVDPVLSLSSRP